MNRHNPKASFVTLVSPEKMEKLETARYSESQVRQSESTINGKRRYVSKQERTRQRLAQTQKTIQR